MYVNKSCRDNGQGASLHLFSSNNVSTKEMKGCTTSVIPTALVCVLFDSAMPSDPYFSVQFCVAFCTSYCSFFVL